MPIPGSGVEYALIYYVDPGPGVWSVPPDVYVLGISSVPYVQSAKGKALGLAGVDVKIAGSRAIGQIPVTATEAMPLLLDVNYPNGGKIWLVSAQYLAAKDACAWTTMTGWGAEILFETSLITYGFEPEQLVAE